MKYTTLLLMFLVLSFNVFSQDITVSGKINSQDSLMILFGNDAAIDTVFTTDGVYSFKRKLTHPELLNLGIFKVGTGVSDQLAFFMEAGDLIVNSNFPGLSRAELVMEKHEANHKYHEFKQRFDPLVAVARSIIDSSFVKGRTEGEKAIFRNLYKRLLQIEDEVAVQFVLQNTDNVVGAYIFNRYLHGNDLNKLTSIYEKFNPALHSTRFLTKIKERITALSLLKINGPAPLFSAVTHQGSSFNLSDLKGKYVVLDFWGSWCPPCIDGLPKMKDYYNRYKGKIEFVGIACNDTDKDWRDAIQKNDLHWIHLLNDKKVDDLVLKYNIEVYPTKILIDEGGNIIRFFTGETSEFYDAIDQLFSPSGAENNPR